MNGPKTVFRSFSVNVFSTDTRSQSVLVPCSWSIVEARSSLGTRTQEHAFAMVDPFRPGNKYVYTLQKSSYLFLVRRVSIQNLIKL
jgi:hypothetical protein